jgi:hypothetical protein
MFNYRRFGSTFRSHFQRSSLTLGSGTDRLSITLATKVRSESRCVLIKYIGSDVHERLYRPEPV